MELTKKQIEELLKQTKYRKIVNAELDHPDYKLRHDFGQYSVGPVYHNDLIQLTHISKKQITIKLVPIEKNFKKMTHLCRFSDLTDEKFEQLLELINNLFESGKIGAFTKINEVEINTSLWGNVHCDGRRFHLETW